jgi:site-specific recombinase XerD
VCDAYEAAHVASLRPTSRGVYRAALKRLRARFGSQRITQIVRADIRRFVNELANEHKANTVRKYYAVMRAVFTFAADDLDIPVILAGRAPRPG